MRKSTRNTLLLAVMVAVLGGAVFAELERERALAAQPLMDLNPDHVQRVEIRCRDCQTRRFERDASGWRMLEPYAAMAKAESVQHLLAVARAPVRTRAKFADYDAAKLGLAPAQFTLKFDQSVVEIGDEDPIEHDRYVKLGDELLRVPDRFSARLLESPESELADPKAAH
jgi:hypothetical protein